MPGSQTGVEGGGSEIVALPGLQIGRGKVSVLPTGVDGVRIIRGDLPPPPVPAVHGIPVAVGDAQGVPGPARPAPDAVVLKSAAHLIRRERAVDDHRVELPYRDRHVLPRPAAVL